MIFVSDISSKVLCSGLEVTVYGGFFDVRTNVKIGGKDAVIVEFDDDFVTAVVPEVSGDVSFVVNDGAGRNVDLGVVRVGELSEYPTYEYVRDYVERDFEDYVLGLLPPGQVLDLENGSNLRKLFYGVSLAILYLWSLIKDFVVATDPLKTENFEEWEYSLALPESGIAPVDDDHRRRELLRVYSMRGGCSINFYKKILTLISSNADIYEYTRSPEKFANIDLGQDDPNFYMMIRFRIPEMEFKHFEAGAGVAGDRIMDFVSYNFESVFNKIKQSHIKIIYSYLTQENMYLVTSSGLQLITGSGDNLIAYAYPA